MSMRAVVFIIIALGIFPKSLHGENQGVTTIDSQLTAKVLPTISGLHSADVQRVAAPASMWNSNQIVLYRVTSDFDITSDMTNSDYRTNGFLELAAQSTEIEIPSSQYSYKVLFPKNSDDEVYFIKYETGERFIILVEY